MFRVNSSVSLSDIKKKTRGGYKQPPPVGCGISSIGRCLVADGATRHTLLLHDNLETIQSVFHLPLERTPHVHSCAD